MNRMVLTVLAGLALPLPRSLPAQVQVMLGTRTARIVPAIAVITRSASLLPVPAPMSNVVGPVLKFD